MLYRDKIILKKVLSEIEIGTELLGNASQEAFLCNEMQKRAVSMTVINMNGDHNDKFPAVHVSHVRFPDAIPQASDVVLYQI